MGQYKKKKKNKLTVLLNQSFNYRIPCSIFELIYYCIILYFFVILPKNDLLIFISRRILTEKKYIKHYLNWIKTHTITAINWLQENIVYN